MPKIDCCDCDDCVQMMYRLDVTLERLGELIEENQLLRRLLVAVERLLEGLEATE